MLGVSRGGPDVSEIVDSMEVHFLFTKILFGTELQLRLLKFGVINLNNNRKEVSICYLYSVEMVHMPAPMQSTMRYSILADPT